MEYPHNHLRFHDERNVDNADLYISFLRVAYADTHEVVLAGHHFMCTPDTGDALENLKRRAEIPSADSVIFDHDMMRTVFKERFIDIIVECAKTPPDQREKCLRRHFLAAGYSILGDHGSPHPTATEHSRATGEGMPESPAVRPYRTPTEEEVWSARAQVQV